MKLFLFVVIISTFSANVYAERVPDVCKSYIERGLFENTSTMSSSSVLSITYLAVQSINENEYAKFSQKAREAGVDMKILDNVLGINGSDNASKKQDLFKSNKSYLSDYSRYYDANQSILVSSQSKVAESIINAMKSCHTNYFKTYAQGGKKGTFINVFMQGNFKDFTVHIAIKENRTDDRRIISFSPSSMIECKFGGETLDLSLTNNIDNGKIFDTEDIQLDCTKPYDEEVSFSVSTTAGNSNVVTIPSKDALLLEMEDRVRQYLTRVELKASGIDYKMAALDEKINNIDAKTKWMAQNYCVVALPVGREQDVDSCPSGFSPRFIQFDTGDATYKRSHETFEEGNDIWMTICCK